MPFSRSALTWAENFIEGPKFKALPEASQEEILIVVKNMRSSYENNTCKTCGQPDNEEHPCDCQRLPPVGEVK